jgi:hypothetical protein
VLTGDDICQRDIHFGRGGGDRNRCVAEVLGDDFGVVAFREPSYPVR